MRGARSSIAGVCLLAVMLAAARAEEGAPLESAKKPVPVAATLTGVSCVKSSACFAVAPDGVLPKVSA